MREKPTRSDPIDRVSCRPDFLVLAYPVISFDPAIAHGGSVRNLLGENPDPKLIEDLSNDLRVSPQTPPTFLFTPTPTPVSSLKTAFASIWRSGATRFRPSCTSSRTAPTASGSPWGSALSEWPVLLTNWLRGRGLTK